MAVLWKVLVGRYGGRHEGASSPDWQSACGPGVQGACLA